MTDWVPARPRRDGVPWAAQKTVGALPKLWDSAPAL